MKVKRILNTSAVFDAAPPRKEVGGHLFKAAT